MPPAHAHVAKLVGRLRGENYVVHNDQNVPFLALLEEFLLLGEEPVHEGLIPAVEKEPRVPLGVPLHHGLKHGAARGRPHKGDHEVEVIKQSVHEVHCRRRLPAPPGSYGA